jgi:peptidoglycan hydrolase-like protein with peptidoglycan-binding domain
MVSFSSNDGLTYRGYGAELLPCITVGATDAASGNAVYKLRYALAQRGLLASQQVLPAGKNSFSSTLQTTVRNFQAAQGLDADGVVGPETWRALGLAGSPCAKTSGTGRTSGVARGSDTSGSGSGSSGGGVQTPATLETEKESITKKEWFWPAVIVGGVGLLSVAAIVFSPAAKDDSDKKGERALSDLMNYGVITNGRKRHRR